MLYNCTGDKNARFLPGLTCRPIQISLAWQPDDFRHRSWGWNCTNIFWCKMAHSYFTGLEKHTAIPEPQSIISRWKKWEKNKKKQMD